MDFKLNRDIITVNETIYDGVQEQSVELDYVLPDYCPEIFKVIKCRMQPRIVSRNISSDRVSYDLAVNITILYLSENNPAVHCVKQKLNYTKSIEFGRAYENVSVCLQPKTDYVNARPINPRRIDLRGAVSIKARVEAARRQEVISDAAGLNVQLRKMPVKYAASRLFAEKQMIISDETEINASKPAVHAIISADAVIIPRSKDVIANKIIVKGDADIKILYSCEKDGSPSLEPLQILAPYSQIIDMDGVDQSYFTIVTPSVSSVEATASGGTDGAFKKIRFEATVILDARACRQSDAEIVTDAYSTAFSCDFSSSKIRLDNQPFNITETAQVKSAVEYSEGDILCVYDVWTEISNVNTALNDGGGRFTVSGMLHNTVIAANQAGMPVTLENTQPFDYEVTYEELTPGAVIEADVTGLGGSYTMTSGSAVSVRNDLRVNASVYTTEEYDAVTDLQIDESEPKERDGDYALKLYYGSQGEDLWEIAKRYSSSVESIMEDNNLLSEILESNDMILIPILT